MYPYRYSTTLFNPPAIEPVTLVEAKAQSRITHNLEDSLFNLYISAARDFAEKITRRQLISAIWDLRMDEFPSGCWPNAIELPFPPLQSVTSVNYVDVNGITTLLPVADYSVDIFSEPGRITPAYNLYWPSTRDVPNAVTIRYTCGYGATESTVPAKTRQAILLLVAHAYEYRIPVVDGSLQEVPMSYIDLLRNSMVPTLV